MGHGQHVGLLKLAMLMGPHGHKEREMLPDEEAFKWAMAGCAKVPLAPVVSIGAQLSPSDLGDCEDL